MVLLRRREGHQKKGDSKTMAGGRKKRFYDPPQLPEEGALMGGSWAPLCSPLTHSGKLVARRHSSSGKLSSRGEEIWEQDSKRSSAFWDLVGEKGTPIS